MEKKAIKLFLRFALGDDNGDETHILPMVAPNISASNSFGYWVATYFGCIVSLFSSVPGTSAELLTRVLVIRHSPAAVRSITAKGSFIYRWYQTLENVFSTNCQKKGKLV